MGLALAANFRFSEAHVYDWLRYVSLVKDWHDLVSYVVLGIVGWFGFWPLIIHGWRRGLHLGRVFLPAAVLMLACLAVWVGGGVHDSPQVHGLNPAFLHVKAYPQNFGVPARNPNSIHDPQANLACKTPGWH
jgi:hypothetical protein